MPTTFKGTRIEEWNLGDSNVANAYMEGRRVYREFTPTIPSVPINFRVSGRRTAGGSYIDTLTWSPPANTGGVPVTYETQVRNTSSGIIGVWVNRGNALTAQNVGRVSTRQFRVRATNSVGDGPATAWTTPTG